MSSSPAPSVARAESAQGWIEFARRPVPRGLAGLVAGRCGGHELAATEVQRRLPASSLVPVVISFGDRQQVVETAGGEGGGQAFSSFVAGLRAGHTLTRFRGEQGFVQVYLRPLGVQQVLGVPAREVANRVVDLDLVAPPLAALADRLAEARTWRQRLDLVDRTLLDLAGRGFEPDPVVRQTWAGLRRTGGTARVSHLARETGFSQRLVTGRFAVQVGVAPKAAARILRFERAAAAVSAGRPLADVAAMTGYADQSHLTREFASLAGTTPAAWAAAAPPTPYAALGITPGRTP